MPIATKQIGHYDTPSFWVLKKNLPDSKSNNKDELYIPDIVFLDRKRNIPIL